ncbi:SusC/RagA family TonB-linked outer membrane protein [Chitinophaga dinghuensis]|nr:SusC/RagA family TonB-linked outer membrane protein [Chitinophaga dinghuensis]
MRTTNRMRYLLLAALLPASSLYAQRVTLSANRLPLEKVCKEVEKQTGYYFVYPKDLREKEQQISVDLKDVPVTTALQQIFDRTPFNYQVTDKVVSVNTNAKKTDQEKVPKSIKDSVSITVKGRIYSANAGVLENASVSTSYTKKTTLTNSKGEYELKGVLLGEQLQISYVGYEQYKEVIMNTEMNVFLKAAENQLDKVVVKAYGVTSKRFNTSNIVTVSGKDIQDLPIQNPLLALEGRVPGLQITMANNSPGSPMKIEIRGRNAINQRVSSDPLFVIDGVPQTVMDFPSSNDIRLRAFNGTTNIISNGLDQSGLEVGLNPMFGLSPNDIESIEVLKDAGATAIYGSRGANGVILITTKKAKTGITKFSLNLSQGVKNVIKKQTFLNTEQFRAMRREAYANSGLTPTNVPGRPGYAPELFLMDSTRYTDWSKFMYGKAGLYTTVNPQLTGGSSQISYVISANYTRQQDITLNAGVAQSTSFLVNLNNHSLNNRFRSGVSFIYMNNSNGQINGTANNPVIPPMAPDPFDSLGKLNYLAYRKVGLTFPFSGYLQPVTSGGDRINASFNAGYTLLKGLEFSTQIGYSMSLNNSERVTPFSSLEPKSIYQPTQVYGTHSYGTTQMSTISVEPKLVWNESVGNGVLTMVAGGTYQANRTKSSLITGSGYANDDLINLLEAAPTVSGSNKMGQYKYVGLFASADYTLSEKYMVSLSGRRDGSSRFGPGKRFGNFWSAGAGWIISEEKWAEKLLPKAFTFLKLRGSYGLTGSDGVGDYQYLSQWGYVIETLNGTNSTMKYNDVAPLMTMLAANDQFHWQTNKKSEVALELGLWNKITLTADRYLDRCDNQLLGYPLASFTGFTTVTANSAANVQNSGWDFMVDATAIQKKDFSWNIGFNINFQRNKLISYPNLMESPYASLYRIGESLNNLALYHYLGSDPATGKGIYYDANKDGKINTNSSVAPGTADDDRVVFLDMNPKFSGGFYTTFRYKNWSLNPTFTFKRAYQKIGYMYDGSSINNMTLWQYENRWTPENPNALLPPLTAVPSQESTNFWGSDRNYKMINTFRLNNLRLSWTMPASMARKAHMQSFAFNLTANNLWLITNYKAGVDPESYEMAPSLRTVTLGCNVSF